MDYESLGRKIRNVRKQRGLTQKESAEMIGISTAFFGLIERGQRKASIETLVSICNVLNVSMDELLEDSLRLNRDQNAANYELLSENIKLLSDTVKKIQEYI
ncbi:MAG: helix-turn-helix domain-containing protein [Christensenellales bacterium]|jgi:transcriptional regulator with XRE-family HTH domain